MIRFKEFIRKLHQKKSVRFCAYAFVVVGIPVFGLYAHFIEPGRMKVSNFRIPIRRLPRSWERFRIVQISDIHFGPANLNEAFLRKCVEKINSLEPDVIALTGDFMQWDSKHARPLAQILSSLKSKLGTFSILGNHDYGVCHPGHPATDDVDHEEVIREFTDHGIRVLHNERVRLEKDGHPIDVVGLGDYWTSHFKPESAFPKNENSSQPTILLSHNPDSIFELLQYDFDLMLAGHVHGGQISFPFIGPLVVPVKNRHLRRGLHAIKDRWLYTNRGLGHIFKARFLSPPEIACLDLIPAEGQPETSGKAGNLNSL